MSDASSTPSSPQVQRFLDELKELQAVFVLGQRSLPFLEELFDFVQDITLLMEEVDAAIHAQTGDMPRATSRLKSVSEATELATNEILDLADAVLAKLRNLKKRLKTSENCFGGLAATDERLLTLLQDELGEEHAGTLTEVKALLDEKQALRQEGAAELEAVRKALSSIRMKVNHIMMSLQVQDITAQQIASVNHLIESVRGRMGDLMEGIGLRQGGRRRRAPAPEEASTGAFDAEARYDHTPDRQSMADDLVAELASAADAGGDGAAGDGAATPAMDAPAESTPEEAPSSSNAPAATGEAASQDDIDELFASYGLPGDSSSEEEDAGAQSAEDAGVNEVASEDDIDQIFQQNA